MKNLFRAIAIVSALCTLAPLALSAGNPKCPKCHMELSSKKDKKHPVMVKMGKKTYYCCSTCGAHKSTAKPQPIKVSPIKGGGTN